MALMATLSTVKPAPTGMKTPTAKDARMAPPNPPKLTPDAEAEIQGATRNNGVVARNRLGDRPGGAQILEPVDEGLLDFVVDAALVEFGGQADGVLDGVRIRAAVTDNADAFRAQ